MSAFTRLGRAVCARPRAVAVAIAALALVSGLYGANVSEKLLAGGIDVPGSESDRAAKRLTDRLGIANGDVVAMLYSPDLDVRDPEYVSTVLDGLDQLYEDPAVVGAITHYDTGLDFLVSRDGHRTIVLIDLAGTMSEMVAALPRVEKLLRELFPGVEISGPVPAEALAQSIAERDVGQAEMYALPLAALLTLLFFRSVVAALLPIAIGAVAMALSVAVLRALSNFLEISVFSLNVSAFLGLGLSIDYALLTVQRFREEMPRSASPADAVIRALDTAGRAVWISGLTVMVSMAVLFVVPLPLVRSVALGGILAVANALFGALVMLPALLAWLGPRVNRFALGRAPEHAGPSRAWAAVGEFANRHPWLTAGGCTLLLLLAAAPALRMRAAMPDTTTFPRGSEVRTVDERIADPAQFDPTGASALQIVLETEGPVLAPDTLRRVQDYLGALSRVPGIAKLDTALGRLDPDQIGNDGLVTTADPDLLTQLDRTVDGDLALITAQGTQAFRTQASAQLVGAVRGLPHPGRSLEVTGTTATLVDVNETLERYALLVGIGVVGWNLAVLFRAFRSVLVPLKAAVMNLLSLGASFGVLVWVFQDGHLAGLLRFEPPNGIEPTIPLMLAAIVFGLSMDYEVFLLARIQEEYRQHRDNPRSIVAGLAHTGRVISSAAAILLVVIGAFAAGELVFVKEIGVGMSAAIALDVTLVRALLVPATMRLLGDWNWWAPRWLGGGITTPNPS
ncbi:MAG TPA: MMPL family transporter [Myxococcota bacterium]|nr:MMPL family transporter [Myxococcota bacterium]